MTFYELNEAVTKSKYDKYMKKIESNKEYEAELMELNFTSEGCVKKYVEKVFGQPSGIYKNTFDEQVGILRRVYDAKKAVEGTAIRSEYSAIG